MEYTNDMTDEEVFRSLLPTIKSIYKSFEYTGISFDDYSNLVLDEIASTDDYEQLKNNIKVRMDNEVEKLLADKDEAIRIINSYIDFKLSKISSYDEAIKGFRKLDSFFEKYDFFVDQKLLMDLIMKSDKFELMIDHILKKNGKNIIAGKAEEMFDSDFLILTVKTYYDLQGVQINEKEDDINSSSFDDVSADLDIVRLYLNELKAPLLSAEEEKKLLLEIEQGNMKAREKFIESNLRLVVNVAKRFQNRGLPFLDLIQEGNIGLMKAIEKFDVERNTKFSTYAVYQIRVAITRALDNQGRNIRIPTFKQEELRSYISEVRELEKKLERSLSHEEISKRLGKSIDKINELESLKKGTISINSFVGEKNDSELEQFISISESVEDEVIKTVLPAQVRKLLEKAKLSEQQLDVLLSRFGIGKDHIWTLEELSKKYSVSRAWIGQVELSALKKIRKLKSTEEFSVYMDSPDLALQQLKKLGEKPIRKEKKKTGKRGSVLKSIYQYFEDFSREDVDSVLDGLSSFEKNLVFLRYGDDLDKPISSTLFGEEECKKFYGALLPKMRKKLYALQDTSALEILKKDKHSDVFRTDNPIRELTMSDYAKLIELLKNPDISKTMENLSVNERVIVSLRLGYVDGKHFSVGAISEFLGISNYDIIKMSNDILTNHADSIDGILNKAIEISNNSSVKKGKILTKSNDSSTASFK